MVAVTAAVQSDKGYAARTRPTAEGLLRRTFASRMAIGGWDEGERSLGATLQRTCACGQHVVGGGQCEACRQRHDQAETAHGPAQETGGELALTASPSRFQHDFSRVATTAPPIRHDWEAGGEGPGDDDTEADLGGELASVASPSDLQHDFNHVAVQSPPLLRHHGAVDGKNAGDSDHLVYRQAIADFQQRNPKGGILARQRQLLGPTAGVTVEHQDHSSTLRRKGKPKTPAAAATLTSTTVTAPQSLGCGGFRSQVRWGISGATDTTNGFVVQKVQFNVRRTACAGGDNNVITTYWEAWQVRGGNIFVGTGTSPHRTDTFQVGPAPDHRGVSYEAGWAKFIPDYTAPTSWGHVPQALSLPSTTSEPAGWSDSGTLHRWMRNTFNCCDGATESKFESSG